MTPIVVRRARLLDPAAGLDEPATDCLIAEGRIAAVGRGLAVPDGTVAWEAPGSVVAPAFLDCHVHLRTPGQTRKETIARGTQAAARGGFAAVCAMANTTPPVDDPAVLGGLQRQNAAQARVAVHQFAACTVGLEGREPVDVERLADLGAAGFSDDGRHAMAPAVLAEVLRRAGRRQLVVAIHPEDEAVLRAANPGNLGPPSLWAVRPADAEAQAVLVALDTLARTPGARLHLQHLSTRAGLDLVRAARRAGLAVTCEVTPHHLALIADPQGPDGGTARACNPPLRSTADREACWAALIDGTIDAVATDHAPHEPDADPSRPQPGFSGLEVALGVLLGLPGADEQLPRLVAALTTGPSRVLGAGVAPAPSLRPGAPADLVWFNPRAAWTPSAEAGAWCSGGRNTPFWATPLRGRVLATVRGGRPVYLRVPAPLVASRPDRG